MESSLSTERQTALERRIAALESQLDEVLRQEQAMLYTLSHDLRTPIMTILGFTDMLIADFGAAGDQEQTVHYLQNIRQAAVRQSKTIEELLKLSRVSHIEIKPEHVDLMELVRHSVERLRSADPKRQVAISLDGAGPMHVDRELFGKVVDELLDNAWKFTSKRADAAIGITIGGQPHEPVYCIADNGIGFDPASADRLFQPLKRLHNDKDFPGAGMGLATAASIIRRHGGRIWADAAPGEGARFYFTVATPA